MKKQLVLSLLLISLLPASALAVGTPNTKKEAGNDKLSKQEKQEKYDLSLLDNVVIQKPQKPNNNNSKKTKRAKRYKSKRPSKLNLQNIIIEKIIIKNLTPSNYSTYDKNWKSFHDLDYVLNFPWAKIIQNKNER